MCAQHALQRWANDEENPAWNNKEFLRAKEAARGHIFPTLSPGRGIFHVPLLRYARVSITFLSFVHGVYGVPI